MTRPHSPVEQADSSARSSAGALDLLESNDFADEPSTETVDRVRWERGLRAAPAGARWVAPTWEAA